MADNVSFRIEGADQVERMLRNLGGEMAEKVLKQTVRAAARPMIKRARQIVDSETIAKGIRTIGVEVDEIGTVTGRVGLPGGRHPWYHGLFVEFGTGPRVQKTTGRRTGSMPAKPFMRPAMDETHGEMVETFAVEVRKRIQKYRYVGS